MPIVYRKTAKGAAEVETRANRLPPRLRSALIIVDGKRSDAELAKLLLQDPEGTLQTLVEGGYIEAAPAPPPSARPPSAAARPAVPSGPSGPSGPSHEQTRREAVFALTELVGPRADEIAMKMERTRKADELRPLLIVARQLIGYTRGPKAAADYGTRFGIGADDGSTGG